MADGKNMYCLLDDGTWTRFSSDVNPNAEINAYRAFYLSDAPIGTPAGVRRLLPDPGHYSTVFSNLGSGNVSDSSLPDPVSIIYDADLIPCGSGDVNEDGELDEKDVKAIADQIMGQTPEGFNKKNADLNGDGMINAADIVELLNKKK